MSDTWLKMCGLKQPEAISLAVELGADAIGLVFYPPSSRAIAASDIGGILPEQMGKTRVVALFVDPEREQVEEVLASDRIDLLQFHGDESPDFCASFGLPYMKAAGVRDGTDVASIEQVFEEYAGAEFILLDAFDARDHGGTGHCFDWAQAALLPAELKQRLILAGGLNPGNVVEAIHVVRPFGVDVSSGIESEKGVKDLAKMRQFREGVRSA